jgi:UPF0755 protein
VKKSVLIASILLALTVSVAAYLYSDLLRYVETPASMESAEAVVVVPPGERFQKIAESLRTAGVLNHPLKFRLYARLKGYDKRIKAGEYLLSKDMSPDNILQALIEGRIRLHKVTVPEGYTQKQVAELLEASGLTTKEDFLKAATNPAFLKSEDIDADSFEGYLFPETYFFPLGVTPEKIISTMVHRLREQFRPEWKKRAEILGFSIHEIITLASIIEKEAGTDFERPIIASVFHNRLRKGMRLESDPTVIYGIKDFDGNLTRKHLKTTTRYNTYRIKGLPPSPIANPGADAIEAALYPAETAYLFFVSKNDRTHQFSSTIAEHNRAVRKYQLRK